MDFVIFACVHNAGRSQMAAAFFAELADPGLATVVSAGTEPADRVHPVVADAMAELGIDVTGAVPRRLTPELAAGAAVLVTLGCGEACPYVPGAEVRDWPLPDPKGGGLPAVRAIRDEVRRRVIALVDERGWARRPMPRRYIAASDAAFPVGWTLAEGRARRRVTLPDFASALRLAVAIGAEAEALDHHPDLAFGWGWLEISCTTHDAGGLTDADVALAHAAERLLGRIEREGAAEVGG